MKKLMTVLVLTFVLTVFVTANGQGEASNATGNYPAKAITFVIPFNAGGGTDLAARNFLKTLAKYIDVDLVATNITGAGGTVGAQHVLESKPDGYTLLVAYAGYPVPSVMGKVDWTYEDFTPIAKFSLVDNNIVVQSESEYNSIMDLVDSAKKNPGQVKVGAGIGTMAHFGLLAIQKEAGVRFNIVDVGGTVPKAPELLAGRIEGYFDPIISCAQFIQAGQFRSLGIYSAKRNSMFPDVKTFKEQGLDIVLPQHYGIWAPPGVSDEVVSSLNEAIKKACSDPELETVYREMFMIPDYTGYADYRELLAQEYVYLETLGEQLAN